MSTLLLRLCAPMQSWGLQGRFPLRDTSLEPSKSAVVGLLCAALGRNRGEPVDDLTALRMGTRADQEGNLARDYQTAMNVLRARGGIKPIEPSTRYYLADARFLVGLEGDSLGLLRRLHEALRDPRWPLYLGRKAFPPSEPVWLPDGIRPHEDLETALRTYPWLGPAFREPPEQVRLVIEAKDGSEVRPDQPVSLLHRRFLPRRVRTIFIPAPRLRSKEDAPCICPD